MAKRLFDIVASGFGLLCLSPVFIIVAIWIIIDSSGPVFYRQTRVGRFGRNFRIFKFRSMRVGSDKGILLTVGGHDPRITRSGAFVRKFKIDELPQLINVFVGDMSFVGPRPEVPYYVEMYTEEQKGVLSVRPGITDLASIKYRDEHEILGRVADPEAYYVSTLMTDKLNINLEYVKKHSFIGDIKIIFMTIFEIFS